MLTEFEITGAEFLNMKCHYKVLVEQLPPHLQTACPYALDKFLSPIGLSKFNFDYFDQTVALSVTGRERWQMLSSPHARALLQAWAIKRLTHNMKELK